MTLTEPWVIGADRHTSEKGTIFMNMFKTIVAHRGAAPIFTACQHGSPCRALH